MKLRERRLQPPDVNLTPLIDVVFLLLIFFMVSTTFDEKRAIAVELPRADSQESAPEKASLELTIDRQGQYYIDQQRVLGEGADALRHALGQAIKGRSDLPVVVNADGKAPFQAVATAMGVAGQLGVQQLSFSTRTGTDRP